MLDVDVLNVLISHDPVTLTPKNPSHIHYINKYIRQDNFYNIKF